VQRSVSDGPGHFPDLAGESGELTGRNGPGVGAKADQPQMVHHAAQPPAVLTERVGSADAGSTDTGNRSLVLFDGGDEVTVQAGDEGIRFLLVSGKPIEEPVAWYGPIVMNTQEQLQQAYAELRNGTFIK